MFYLITEHQKSLTLSDEDCRKLAEQVLKHDSSKFNRVQFEPYIELTEYYHQRKALGNKEYEYPSEEIKAQVDMAIHNHYACENHHAERYGDVSMLDDKELIEVCCDLQAMAQEFKEGSCRGYFEKIWGPKYELEQYPFKYKFMDKVISCFEKKNRIIFT